MCRGGPPTSWPGGGGGSRVRGGADGVTAHQVWVLCCLDCSDGPDQ